MLFTQSTGGKLDNFDAFLAAANERPTTQATTNDNFAKQFERSLWVTISLKRYLRNTFLHFKFLSYGVLGFWGFGVFIFIFFC